MKNIVTTLLLILFMAPMGLSQSGPIGWASVNANGQNGTTGGEGGTVVTVNNMTDLIMYTTSNQPYIIEIEGMIPITPKGRHISVTSNKTILGKGAGAGIYQGGFSVGSNQKNIIFRNLTISDTYVDGDWDGKEQDWDGIQIKGTCSHIWVDHCTLLRQGDGALDITNGASYITVSWSVIGANNKASLIGSSDTDSHTDKYKVTFHHNWFNATTQRNPRVRFGQVHLFNNYYYNMGGYGREMGYAISNGYAIGVGVAAQVWSEKNYFENVVFPSQYYDSQALPGYIIDNGSFYLNSGKMATRPGGINWDPSNHYDYTLNDAETVKEMVMLNAGAQQAPTNSTSRLVTHDVPEINSFPNPFTSSARVEFTLIESSNTTVRLLDITGREVKLIANENYPAGTHRLIIDRGRLNAGIYLLQLETAGQSVTRRLVIQ